MNNLKKNIKVNIKKETKFNNIIKNMKINKLKKTNSNINSKINNFVKNDTNHLKHKTIITSNLIKRSSDVNFDIKSVPYVANKQSDALNIIQSYLNCF